MVANFSNRRFVIPEVVQTSGMDCGPASLKCLLEGFGVATSYGRLREACQTDVDGTSIDTMEEIAQQLGLQAEQIMIPVDHLLLPEAKALPAIVVVRLPNGFTHFVVAWRVHAGKVVQVMDPATGRRWPTVQQFLNSIYHHTFPVPSADWREWAATADFLNPLQQRLANLGVRRRQAQQLIETAVSDPKWKSLARLDAATRMVAALLDSGSIRRGQQASRILESVFAKAAATSDEPEEASIPTAYWSVQPVQNAEGEEPQLYLRGAVLVRAQGVRDALATTDGVESLSPELTPVLAEKPTQPLRELWQFLRADGLLTPFALLPALFVAALAVVIEAVLLRGLLDLGGVVTQRWPAITAVLLFSLGLVWLRWQTVGAIAQLGRQLEARLRLAFLQKIPRLRDQYFRSRPQSDMAQRSHSVHHLRDLPRVGAELVQATATLLLTTAGIIWLSPSSAPLAAGAAVVSLGLPLLLQSLLSERDMRMRTHTGALSRFYLDSLLGLTAVRAHSAERAVRREHESLLIAWGKASFRFYRAVIGVTGVQLLFGLGFAIWLLFDYVARGGSTSGILLLVYWVLNLPTLGQQVALLARQYPRLRNTTLRLLEPLKAREEGNSEQLAAGSGQSSAASGVAIEMDKVSVVAAGRTILQNVNLQIAAGETVAIVGASGAGKSSLVGLLLGWQRVHNGRLLINKQPLTRDRLAQLRAETAWVDPSIQLWNRPLIDNLRYGQEHTTLPVGEIIDQAQLLSVLRKLPNGLQTSLGEGGGLVSGGEGQRVRLGRALGRKRARLVILDEPFRGLDRQQRGELLQLARRHWAKATLLCITHDVAETNSFDRVLVVANGRLVEDGKPSILAKTADSHYRHLLNAEQETRQRLWQNNLWRRVRVENGRLFEHEIIQRQDTINPNVKIQDSKQENGQTYQKMTTKGGDK